MKAIRALLYRCGIGGKDRKVRTLFMLHSFVGWLSEYAAIVSLGMSHSEYISTESLLIRVFVQCDLSA